MPLEEFNEEIEDREITEDERARLRAGYEEIEAAIRRQMQLVEGLGENITWLRGNIEEDELALLSLSVFKAFLEARLIEMPEA